MAELCVTILGCGSSGGVPRVGGAWGACDPQNPKNRRSRCSILVEQHGAHGTTRVVIDTGPDFRDQMLRSDVGTLDAVLYTHDHADHTHGIDDLRVVTFNIKARLPIHADPRTAAVLRQRFDYVFATPEGSDYPPILDLHEMTGPVTIEGAGGAIIFNPFRAAHGRMDALGFRFGRFAYLPDVSAMYEEGWQALEGARCWIIDALRYTPHVSHTHVDQTLEWIEKSGVPEAYITNMHIDLDYAALEAYTPAHVHPAYDGLTLREELGHEAGQERQS